MRCPLVYLQVLFRPLSAAQCSGQEVHDNPSAGFIARFYCHGCPRAACRWLRRMGCRDPGESAEMMFHVTIEALIAPTGDRPVQGPRRSADRQDDGSFAGAVSSTAMSGCLRLGVRSQRELVDLETGRARFVVEPGGCPLADNPRTYPCAGGTRPVPRRNRWDVNSSE
jgi:hypothetical protein